MTRISHTEFSDAQRDFTNWWRSKQAPTTVGRSFGYGQAVKLAIYRFHKLDGDRSRSLAHFDQLVTGRLRDARKIAQARLQLEAYLDWHRRSGVVVADHRIRLNLPLGDGVALGGEVSRIDVEGRRYRAVLLTATPSRTWRTETRMPLIQLAVAHKYERANTDIDVAVQRLDGSDLEVMTFSRQDLQTSMDAAADIAHRIQKLLRRR